ncbi:MAG: hypothetical protein ACUVUE_03680 [Candidatus Bathycorpusculaceae bacterium]
MGRMLLYVPRMYTESEFRKLALTIPEDFQQKTDEFWSYVKEKLAIFEDKIQRIYRDEIDKSGEAALNHLSVLDGENYMIVKRLVEKGAYFEATEDSMLMAESESWLEMLNSQAANSIVLENYEETLRERDRHVSRRIDETLKDNEVGVLFMDPDRNITVDADIKVIKVFRFDPTDYLRSWQALLKTKYGKM